MMDWFRAVSWDLVLDYLLEVRTEPDTPAGLESLGRLARCNSAMRVRLRSRIRASYRRIPGLHRIPWNLVLDYLLEVRTELDETTSAGLESLGTLIRCSSALRECLIGPIHARDQTVRQMTDRFIRGRAAMVDAHPNIILRGRLWHDYDQAYYVPEDMHVGPDGPDNMHVRLAEELDLQQWRFQELAWRVALNRGQRKARKFAAAVARAFLRDDLADIDLGLRLIERELDRIFDDGMFDE